MEIRDMPKEPTRKMILVYKDSPEGLCRQFIVELVEQEDKEE